MPGETEAGTHKWNVLLVEDEKTIRRQIREYLSAEMFASRGLNIIEIDVLGDALNLIRERKADLVILDVYRGKAQRGGEQTGVQILESIKRSGFVPVVLHTALPEGLESLQGKFVRLVGKDAGLEKLKEQIAELFALRIPQVNRAIVNHFDQTMRAYMWDFVQEHWTDFEPLVDKPEFLRLVVQRLARTLARQGIERMAQEVYGDPRPVPPDSDETVHPAECYVKPPIGDDPMLGDIRRREGGERSGHLVVLWPSCDMVSTGGRTQKTDFALCARALPAIETPEVLDWLSAPSNTKEKAVQGLAKNRRGESPDRYHFLPGVWDIPDLVVDFQALEHVAMTDIRAYACLATLASPFAEALTARFQKYIGRVGTPDVDVESVMARMRSASGTPDGGGTGYPR
ncbi:MAG: response regulator [Desulfobacteria bacterium]